MSVDSKYQVTYQRPSQHVFYAFSATSLANTFEIPFNTQFPVKEVRISNGFTGYSEMLINVYAVMPSLFPSSDVVANFASANCTDAGPDYVYSGNLQDGSINYILREPQIISGTHTLRLFSVGNTAPGARFALQGILHFELLG